MKDTAKQDRTKIKQNSFSKIPSVIKIHNLNEIQLSSFENFLQSKVPPSKRSEQGLQAAFKSIFPITDVHNTASLEFVEYSIGVPKYSKAECIERDMTYAAPLKATLQLTTYEKEKSDWKFYSRYYIPTGTFL